MQKRKGNLLQKAMSVLLSAALIVGMVTGTASAKVWAQEETPENIKTEDIKTEDVDNTEEVTETNTFYDEDIPDDTVASDGQEEDEIQTDLPIDSEEDIAVLYMEGEKAYQTVRDANQSEAEYSLDGGTTWTDCDALVNVLWENGYTTCQTPKVRLKRDVTLDTASIQLLCNNNVTFDGQGHTIHRGSYTAQIFNINMDGQLRLENVVIDGGAVWDNAENVSTRVNSGYNGNGTQNLIYIYSSGAEVTLGNGVILQNNSLNQSAYNGAAVWIQQGSLVMENGAVIRNNSAVNASNGNGGGAGAVNINSGAAFTMNGGEIYGNYASSVGGAIYNEGRLEIKGGKIYNNASVNNGGAVINARSGSVTMIDGEITGNSSRLGGGVLENGGGFAMNGGKIHSNTSTQRGGGIYCNNNSFSVSGNVQITNNKNGETVNNVYLPSGKTITVSAALTDGANIGITTQTAPTEAAPVNITGTNAADYSAYFKSDNENYIIKNTDNVVRLAVKPPHMHTLTHHEAVGATCTEAGTGEYWKCEGEDGCGGLFSDASAATEITEIPAGDSATGHSYSAWSIKTEPTTEATGTAERVCTKNSEHKETVTLPVMTDTTVWTAGTRTEPTETADGSQTYTSEYGTVTVIIPATGGSGDNPGVNTGGSSTGGDDSGSNAGSNKPAGDDKGIISKDVEKAENVPAIEFPASAQELADMLLTDTEKQQLADGMDIKIILDVKDASDSVSSEDKAFVEAVLGGNTAVEGFAAVKSFTVGQYLDVSLFKIIGENRSAIHETNRKITVTIAVPDSLKNTDSQKTRTFAVIRVHNGQAEVLNDLDSSMDTITIATDRFSTYAIVYTDTANGGNVLNNNNQSNQSKDNEPKTGDNTPLELCATLSMISGLAYLLLYFADGRCGMTEETKKELVSGLVGWARKGGKIRKLLALAAIFGLLVFYHSIGKKTAVEWKEVYGG